jgi:hypothetical protein
MEEQIKERAEFTRGEKFILVLMMIVLLFMGFVIGYNTIPTTTDNGTFLYNLGYTEGYNKGIGEIADFNTTENITE